LKKSFLITLGVIAFAWFWASAYKKNWSRDQIQQDVVPYYSYLPATFICGDVTLENTKNCEGRYWYGVTPTGGKVIKMTMGLSFMYMPWFLIAHYIIAPLTSFPNDGYSPVYQATLVIGSFLYLLLAFMLLFKILQHYVSAKTVHITILVLFFGTNLLWYSTGEALMSHQYNFFLFVVLLYSTIKWHQSALLKHALLMGFSAGLLTLIRPVNSLLYTAFITEKVF
jgi:hypothetical protein